MNKLIKINIKIVKSLAVILILVGIGMIYYKLNALTSTYTACISTE